MKELPKQSPLMLAVANSALRGTPHDVTWAKAWGARRCGELASENRTPASTVISLIPACGEQLTSPCEERVVASREHRGQYDRVDERRCDV